MRKFAVIACLAFAMLNVGAQSFPGMAPGGEVRRGPGAPIHVSMSRQFMIRETDNPNARPIPLGTDPSVRYVRLDPSLLTVSCERIKHAVLTELDAPDKWHDRIFIDLRHAQTLEDEVIIASQPLERGWSYHVSLPDTIENSRLVTSLIDVLLLEMANRNANGQSAEVPAWLGYGVSEDVMRSTQAELVLEPAKPNAFGMNVGTFAVVGLMTNAMALAHANLQATPPLTVDQLSWPDEARLEGADGETYRSSAQLFVHDLIQLKGGPAALRAFIGELPEHLNWQLSFLHAFRADFASQLELEKWWALRLVDFTGRDLLQAWNPEVSWQKLNDIVRPIVEVRARAEDLPSREEVSLQTIIEKWDMSRQFGFLQKKSRELYVLRSRVSQELAKLTDDYRRTIDLYLDKRAQERILRSARAQEVLGIDHGARQTIDDLNVLDGIREDLRPKPVTIQSADARAAH
jgi:hypothetical protein